MCRVIYLPNLSLLNISSNAVCQSSSVPSINDIDEPPTGQIDNTAAKVTVTCVLFLLYHVKYYDDKFKYPIRLVTALNTNCKVQPIGEGYLCIPCTLADGSTALHDIRCSHSPHVSSTLINENDLYGPFKKSANEYTGMTIVKHNAKNCFTIHCEHKYTNNN